MNENKINKADDKHLKRLDKGLIFLFGDDVSDKAKVEAKKLYFEFLDPGDSTRKSAVSHAIWETIDDDKERIQMWAAALRHAYSKKGPKSKK